MVYGTNFVWLIFQLLSLELSFIQRLRVNPLGPNTWPPEADPGIVFTPQIFR